MLDDIVHIPKVRFFLMGLECLARWDGYLKTRNIKSLVHHLSLPWRLRLVGLTSHDVMMGEIIEKCDDLGLTFWDFHCFSDDASNEEREKLTELVHESDIVYAPQVLKTLPVNSLLRSPQSDRQAVEAACYFSTSAEPFTVPNYYEFLNRV